MLLVQPKTAPSRAARLTASPGHPLPDLLPGRQAQAARLSARVPAVGDFAEQLFDAARDALVIVELASGRIRRWNAAAADLFGYSGDEAVGHSIDLVMPPAVARLHRERIGHFCQTGDLDMLAGPPINVPVRTRSGTEIPAEMSMALLQLPAPAAAPNSLLLSFRDGRCRRELELATLATARAEVGRGQTEARLARLEGLVGETGQQVEVTAARVRRAGRWLARAARDRQEQERIERLAHLVEARSTELEQRLRLARDLAAIETGTFEIDRRRENLVPLVSQLVSDMRARSSAHRLNLGAPQGLTAICDPQRLGAVIEDLIVRAMRRNPRGCWIDIDLRRPLAGVARIDVRDYGRPPSQRERDRLAADRGWLVNRHIVDQHRGSLRVELPREGGVRAVVSLPTHRGRVNPSS